MYFQTRLIYAPWQKHGWNRPTMPLDKHVSLSAIHSQIIPAKVAGWAAALAYCAGQISHHLCRVRSGENKSFGFSEWLITCPSLAIRLIVVYRPTYSKEHPISPAIFNEEFGEYLQGVILSKEPLLITGDFNFHVDDCSDKDAAKLIKRYCLNLDYNNMWMCQLTEMDTCSIFSSPGWAIIPHWTSQLQATTYLITHL